MLSSVFIKSFALLCICSGVTLIVLRQCIFDLIITSAFILTPHSLIYNIWRNPPVSVSANIYIFNWTNPEEVHDLTTKPKLQQVGPYSFKRTAEKVNITWNPNNSTLTYGVLQSYYFDEENSVGKLTDIVTTINTVTLVAAHQLRHESSFTKMGFSLSLDFLAPKLHVTKPVNELLFEGYEDPYVDIGQVMRSFGGSSPDVDRVGFLYGRNNSYTLDGINNIASGVEGNVGEVLNWNYHDTLLHYNNDSCSKLGGSSGEFNPPNKAKDTIKLYIPDAGGNYILEYEKQVKAQSIHGYKYTAQTRMLDNGTIFPENKCFCTGDCIPSGVRNLSSCSFGSPVFISLPHFYGADPYYLNLLEGLKPNKETHEMYIVIQPELGISLDIGLRFQINFLLHPVEGIMLFENLPTVYFPTIWFEQKVSFPSDYELLVKALLSVPTIIIPVIACIFIGGGLYLFIRNLQPEVVKILKRKRESISEKTTVSSDQYNVSGEEVKPMLGNKELSV